MLSEKMRKIIHFLGSAQENVFARGFLLALFVLCFYATRIPRLKNDIINPDAVNWHYRTQQFIVGLKYFQLEKTYQHYHPGVTLMWVTGVPVELFKQITGIKEYTVRNFEAFDFVAKFSLVFVQIVLTLVIIFVFSKIVGFNKAFFTTTLFTFEPFFAGNSRLYHLDVLMTLLLFLGLLFAFINLKKTTVLNSALAGLCLALAFLTKSVSIGAVPFVIFYSAIYFRAQSLAIYSEGVENRAIKEEAADFRMRILHFILSKQPKRFIRYAGLITLFFVLFSFLFFPVLWIKPVYYLSLIFKEAERVGIRKGHEQIVFGEETTDAGFWFYPLVILMKVSPFVLLGCLAFVVKSIKNVKVIVKSAREKIFSPGLYFAVFYIGYVAFMTFPTKKIDRYIIVVYPFLAYLAVLGFSYIFNFAKSSLEKSAFWLLMLVLTLLFWVVPFVYLYPYYFTYTSPIFGSAEAANKIVAQKSFGVGISQLKDFILSRYGNYPTLGFIDTKPMAAIYPNSKVLDIRVYGASSYDLLVLGVNEEMPEDVANNDRVVFEKDSSVWINGLEYWRIHVKKER